jgi:surfactin synthase thioesterase subunit
MGVSVSFNELAVAANWTNGIILRPARAGAIRLFCFPYAGGGASLFRLWPNDLPPAIEVYPIQLPGRESRWREPALTRISALVGQLIESLGPFLDAPFAFFGHSMGAFVSFELARQLRRESRPGPEMIIVSAARAPQIPDPDPPIHGRTADELVGELKRLDGIPAELLDHPDLVTLLLPTLRTDLAMCESYTYADEPPLDCRVAAYGGALDDKVPLHHLSLWRAQTTGAFQLRVFPGKHFFFLKEARTDVTRALSEDLRHFTQGDSDSPLIPAREPVQRVIADVWRELLPVPVVGLDDNFFDLGGNSLLMLQAYYKLQQTLSTSLSVLDLLRYPTIRLLANAMETRTSQREYGGALDPFKKENHRE